MEFNLTLPEIALLFLSCYAVFLVMRYHKQIRRWFNNRGPRLRRKFNLRPREPADCPRCARGICWLVKQPRTEVVPWHEVKHTAGRKKHSQTEGFCCTNTLCDYFGVTDAEVHALVSDGSRNGIPYLKCQACGQRFSSRRDTPMFQIKTPVEQVSAVMTALSEGVDIAAAARIFGHHPATIARWLARGGKHGARLHDRLFFRRLRLGHVQLDELVTRVRSLPRQKVWLWTAVDAYSKLILAFHAGGRAIADACSLAHDIHRYLDPIHPLPVFTSDGLNQYFHGLTAHFGSWTRPPRARKLHWVPDPRLMYAQIRKRRSGRQVKFLYSIIHLGERAVIRARLIAQALSGKIQTAFVERANLTLRELIAPLRRRTWSIAHNIQQLNTHIYWGLTYYHFIRAHQSLTVQVRGPSQHRYRTPAMAAGVTRHRWSVQEILLLPLPEHIWVTPFPAA